MSTTKLNILDDEGLFALFMQSTLLDSLLRLDVNKEAFLTNCFNAYREPHRYYHTLDHVRKLVEDIYLKQPDLKKAELLSLVALFHDLVYDPRRSDNEEKSVKALDGSLNTSSKSYKTIKNIILDTKTHKARSELSKLFCYLDLKPLIEGNLLELLENEQAIFKEYQHLSIAQYRENRVKFLHHYALRNLDVENLLRIIKARVYNVGIYAGTFNPWHKGHANILKKAEAIFDKVIVLFAKNPGKPVTLNSLGVPVKSRFTSFAEMIEAYGLQHHEVDTYSGLLVDYVKLVENDGCKATIIRGLRNGYDFDYELTQLRFMQDQNPKVSVVSITCDREFDYVSSTAIHNLEQLGCSDFSRYVDYV